MSEEHESTIIDETIIDLPTPDAVSDDIRDLVEAEITQLDKPEPTPEPVVEADKPETKVFNAWKPEAQEELAKLPVHVQDMIKDRENQFHQGLQKNKEAAQQLDSLSRVFAPHDDYIKSMNVTREVAVENLLHTERTLRQGTPEQKMAMMHQLASAYGIDMQQLAEQPFDPRINAIEQENLRLHREQQKQQASQLSAQEAEIFEQIDAFKQTHEHFDAVKTVMGDLLDKGLATTLEEAYHKAIRLDDTTFNALQAQQSEASKKAEAIKADQAAKAARAAKVSVKGAPTGATHAKPAETTEEAVRNSMMHLGLI